MKSQQTFGMRYAYPLTLLGASLAGFSPIFVRLSETPPVATAFYRVFFVIPFFLLLMAAERPSEHSQHSQHSQPSQQRVTRNRYDYLLLGALGLVFCFNLIFWNISVFYTSVAYSTLFANLSSIFIIPMGWILFRYRVRKAFVLCALGGFSGVALLLGAQENAPSYLLGNVLAIIAALFYAGYQLIVNRLRSKFTTAEVMMWTGVFTSFFLIPAVVLFGESFWIPSLIGLAVLLAMSLLSHGLGQGLIAYSLGHLPPNLIALTLLVQPVVAAFLGWHLFAELLNIWQLLGICITLFFLYLAKRVSLE